MRLRFSLRLFLIAFTFIAVTLGAAAHFVYRVKDQVRQHNAAVALLEKHGVFVENGGHHRRVYRTTFSQAFAEKWIDSQAFASAGGIRFIERDSADAGSTFYRALPDLQCIRHIEIEVERLTSSKMASLTSQRGLDVLEITFDAIDDDAISKFPLLPELGLLKIGPPLNDELMAAIVRMPIPYYLDIDISELTEDGIESLNRVKTESGELRLHGGVTSSAVLAAIVANPSIEHLSVSDGEITHGALAMLKGAKSIRILWLSESDLPDDYLSIITTLPNLIDLQIDRDESHPLIHIYKRHNAPGRYCEVRKDISVGAKELSAFKSLNNLTGISFTGELGEVLASDFLKSQPNCRIEVECKPKQTGGPDRLHLFLLDGKLVCEETRFASGTRIRGEN